MRDECTHPPLAYPGRYANRALVEALLAAGADIEVKMIRAGASCGSSHSKPGIQP